VLLKILTQVAQYLARLRYHKQDLTPVRSVQKHIAALASKEHGVSNSYYMMEADSLMHDTDAFADTCRVLVSELEQTQRFRDVEAALRRLFEEAQQLRRRLQRGY
jgi:deoxyribodipyrimidine photolyase-like uncharacterized protein